MKSNVNFNDLSKEEQLSILENPSYEDLEQAAQSKYSQVRAAVFLNEKSDQHILQKIFEYEHQSSHFNMHLDLSHLKDNVLSLLKWTLKTAP